MIYLTEYEKDGKLYCGRVEASSWAEADLILKQTGHFEEVVVGTLEMEIDLFTN